MAHHRAKTIPAVQIAPLPDLRQVVNGRGVRQDAPLHRLETGSPVMTQLHLPTLLVATAIQFTGLALVSLPAWRANAIRPGLGRWSSGTMLIAIGSGLFSQRAPNNGLLTIVAANALILGGTELVHVAVRLLYGMPHRPLWRQAVPLVAWLALTLLWALDSSPGATATGNYRVLAFSLGFMYSTGGIARALYVSAPRPWSLGAWYVMSAVAIPFGLHFLRFVEALNHPQPSDPILGSSSAPALFTAISAAGVLVTYGFVLLLNEQLQADLEAANARLRVDAGTDPLTGLANRRRLHELAQVELTRARRYGWPVVVLMLDIDHFKRINDQFGHPAGDAVLRELAAMCQRELRSHDLAARIGGEEFAVVLPHSDVGDGENIANRLLHHMSNARIEAILGEPVTISIGLAEVEPTETDIQPALLRADQALYRAKAAGRNRAVRWW